MRYQASIDVNGELEKVTFETDGNPIEYLWGRYGMASYIEYVEVLDAEQPLYGPADNGTTDAGEI